jgi:hypothetical protein
LVSGCVRLPPTWLGASLSWFCEGGACEASLGGVTHGRIRNALLSYPEEGLASPGVCRPRRDPSGAAWQHQARGEEAGGDADDMVSPVYPRDALDDASGRAGGKGFKTHWRWGGVVVAAAWSVLQRANGFPEDASVSLDLQIEHFKDRAAIFKVPYRSNVRAGLSDLRDCVLACLLGA